MPILINQTCANPECYRPAVAKHRIWLGKLRVEIGLCDHCVRLVDTGQ